MNLLYETNSLYMKGVTNQEVGDTKCCGNKSDFFLIRERKILYKSLATVVLTLC